MTKRSTPSSTSPSPKRPSGSTTSWAIPQPTDVLSYVYLWAREADQGRDEGSKERPVVVVLSATPSEGSTQVVVAPVTTRPSHAGDAVVEMPAAVRARLGLGDARCWIVASEVNSFIWPGPDLRPVRRTGDLSPYYGKVPGNLLRKVRELYRRAGPGLTPRSTQLGAFGKLSP